jgi:hypothetical protein
MTAINTQVAKTQRVPKGRYWVDVFEQNRVAFDAWVDWAVKNNFAGIETTEQFDDRAFVIFSVTADDGAPWPNDEPLPPLNVADSEIQTSADTVKRPDPEPDSISSIGTAFERIKGGLMMAVVALGLVGIVVSMRRS